jgi:hypothetical protein
VCVVSGCPTGAVLGHCVLYMPACFDTVLALRYVTVHAPAVLFGLGLTGQYTGSNRLVLGEW